MNSSTSSGGEKPDNVPARKRQNRQAVLGMLKKVDIKNKGLKRFFYFTYEADPSAAKQEQVKKLYFSNGEICEGDEYFLQHMKKSVFVSNIPGGTKKSELYQLFQRYGMVLSIELRTRGGRCIVGRQPQYPFETGPYLCSTIEFDSPESAKNACEVKTESTYSAKPIMNPSLLGTENCVYVENVPAATTRQELWQHFKMFGPIRSIRMEFPDGTLVLTDAEYAQLRSVNCHIRFRRRAEARAAAKGLNRSTFKERQISVQMAYQKYCNPDELSNNALRIFFQPFGDVVALDQIPHQRAGYVCFKLPIPADLLKRANQQTFRRRRITIEKLELPGIPKEGKSVAKAALGNGKNGREGTNPPGNGSSGSSNTTNSNRGGSATTTTGASSKGAPTNHAIQIKLGRKIARKALPPAGRKPLAKRVSGDLAKAEPGGGKPGSKTAANAENAKENRATS
ncbi:AGAP003170-PA [Anopheles gambiae str. PEST]|uniref:AGAP003170-PA n=1 Tax=Anopheles gambiae TaxID=7165 RepID=Q7QBH7_ANOGA|nr:AGAP003170-PA [Anopheles gambiae str. PEST]